MAKTEVTTANNFVNIEFGNVEKSWVEVEWYARSGFEISTSSEANIGYQSTNPSLEDIEALHKGLGKLIELAKKGED